MIENIEFHFDKPEDNLGFLLWQTTMAWQLHMNRALDEVNLTHTQFVIMAALGWLSKNDYNITQTAIAQHSNTDRMMVSKILRLLQKNKLIQRHEHPEDARAKCVTLTPSGITTLQSALNIVSKADQEFFKDLHSPSHLKHALRQLIES